MWSHATVSTSSHIANADAAEICGNSLAQDSVTTRFRNGADLPMPTIFLGFLMPYVTAIKEGLRGARGPRS